MFSKFIEQFKRFKARGGLWITLATLFNKFAGIALSIIIVRFFSQEDYGRIGYARGMVNVVMPIMGLGVILSFLRFGTKTEARNFLYKKSLLFGLLSSLGIVAVFIALSGYLTRKVEGTQLFVIIASLVLITEPLFQLQQNKFRLEKRNDIYAKNNMLYVIILGAISIYTALTFGPHIYLFSIVLTPLIVFILNAKKNETPPSTETTVPENFYKYGIFTSFSALLNELLNFLPMYMLGAHYGDGETLAIFRVGTLIPIHMLIIPSIIIATDIVYHMENAENTTYLRREFLKYIRILGLLAVGMFVGVFFLGDWFITTLFTDEYAGSVPILKIVTASLIFVFPLRSTAGNLMLAMGKVKYNALNVVLSIGVVYIANLILLPRYGVLGAAMSLGIMFVFSSLFGAGAFWYITRKRSDV